MHQNLLAGKNTTYPYYGTLSNRALYAIGTYCLLRARPLVPTFSFIAQHRRVPQNLLLFLMFERHELLELLELARAIRHDQLHFRDIFMASIQDVKDAQAATAQSIAAIASRIPAPVATAEDLDGLVSTEQANKAAADAIDPAATPVS